jgi:hypothetical protein
MELQNGMKVIAPDGIKSALITSGKKYEVYNVEKIGSYTFFNFIDDIGYTSSGRLTQCSYLNGKDWLTQPSLKQRLLTLTENTPNDMELGQAVRILLRDEK